MDRGEYRRSYQPHILSTVGATVSVAMPSN